MDYLLIFFDVFSLVGYAGLIGFCLFLVKQVHDYAEEVEYYKSICEEAADLSEETKEALDEHIKASKEKTCNAFFAGVEYGKNKG